MKRFTWVVVACNSEDYNIYMAKFEGTVKETKKHIAKLARKARNRNTDYYEIGTVRPADIDEFHDDDGNICELNGYIEFTDMYISYTARRLDSLTEDHDII